MITIETNRSLQKIPSIIKLYVFHNAILYNTTFVIISAGNSDKMLLLQQVQFEMEQVMKFNSKVKNIEKHAFAV